jgi:hypothetical protein
MLSPFCSRIALREFRDEIPGIIEDPAKDQGSKEKIACS